MKTTAYMFEAVRQIRPWVRFLSFFGFALVIAMLIAAGLLTFQGLTEATTTFGTATRLTIAGTLIINALMAIHPSTKLWTFCEAISQFLATKSASALEFGLAEHRRFWQSWTTLTFVAIILNSAVALILYLVVSD